MSTTLYDILEIAPTASQGEIKNAYRKLAKKYHPDKNKESEIDYQKFVDIKHAYEVLSNREKRLQYDNLIYPQPWEFEYVEQKRPRRPPPRYYANYVEYEFSRRTYIYGALFVVGIIAFAMLFPAYLMVTSANTHFDKGIACYEAGLYSEAIDNFTRSANFIGGKTGIANYYNSYILFYHYNNYQITLKYIDKSLKALKNDSLKSELLWMKGRCYQEAGNFDNALKNYSQVKKYNGPYDSVLFYSGIIFSVNEHDYEKGLSYFNEFLKRNTNDLEGIYFKAYSLQKLEKHREALALYDELLHKNFQPGAVYFHKALSELKLNLHENACADLDSAVVRQVEDAEKLKSIYCTNIPRSYNAF